MKLIEKELNKLDKISRMWTWNTRKKKSWCEETKVKTGVTFLWNVQGRRVSNPIYFLNLKNALEKGGEITIVTFRSKMGFWSVYHAIATIACEKLLLQLNRPTLQTTLLFESHSSQGLLHSTIPHYWLLWFKTKCETCKPNLFIDQPFGCCALIANKKQYKLKPMALQPNGT